jgi:RNA polymerase sigma-70 factor, ECF subfamily
MVPSHELHERNQIDLGLMTAVSQTGDTHAFRTLFERYAPIVKGLSYKIIGDEALAEEIVQETFWRVWHNAPSYDAEKGSFATWMFNIARNLGIDALRRYRRTPAQPLEAEDEEQGKWRPFDGELVEDDLGRGLLADYQHRHVHLALQQLSPKQQDIIEWTYFQGKTRRQIAQEQDLPLGTINTRARLALENLRRILHEQGVEEA